jgi:hypothetical protein
MIKRFLKSVMGLIEKSKPKVKDEGLTQKELEFILTKLRTAEYKGSDFEMYFNILKKLTSGLDNLRN